VKILAGTKLEVLISAYRNFEVFGRLQQLVENDCIVLSEDRSWHCEAWFGSHQTEIEWCGICHSVLQWLRIIICVMNNLFVWWYLPVMPCGWILLMWPTDWWPCEEYHVSIFDRFVWCWIWVAYQSSHYWRVGQSSRTSRNEFVFLTIKMVCT